MIVDENNPLTLSQAQGHWEFGQNWVVQTPAGDVLWDFPEGFDENKAMSAIRLGRKFELVAFNRGVDFGKDTMARRMETEISNLKAQVQVLESMNLDLSGQLDRHINRG